MSISESIFSGKTHIIPLADVQHVEKEVWGGTETFGQTTCVGRERNRYTVITNHTIKKDGKWINPIILPHFEGAQFMKSWCRYRYELENLAIHGEKQE